MPLGVEFRLSRLLELLFKPDKHGTAFLELVGAGLGEESLRLAVVDIGVGFLHWSCLLGTVDLLSGTFLLLLGLVPVLELMIVVTAPKGAETVDFTRSYVFLSRV